MGIFDKLFGGKEKESATATMEKPPCPHGVMVPRWDNIDDIGHDDKVAYFVCESCEEKFSPEEAKTLRDTAVERLVGGTD